MTKLVRDLMRQAIIACPSDTTLGQAASLLVQHRLHALIVADADNQPIGVISDIDLLTGEWLSTDADSLATMQVMTVSTLMTSPAATIKADVPASQAAARMQAEHLHRLLVVEEGRPIGVISVSDLVASLAHSSVERRTVAEVMSQGIVVCLTDTPLAAVARAMTERRSRSVVVVEANGQPVGVVTGLDLLAFFEAENGDKHAWEVMHPPITIQPTATLREAADKMIQHHIHRLLVVDPDRPKGMPLGLISTSDIVAEMAEPGSVWQERSNL
jgi:CBS domain-containing protein